MFDAIIAMIGLAFAAWGVMDPAAKERLKINLHTRRQWLRLLGFISLSCMLMLPLMPFSLGWSQSLVVLLAIIGVVSVAPLPRMSAAQLRAFRHRVEPLILTGRPDVVIDVIDGAFPDTMPTLSDDPQDASKAISESQLLTNVLDILSVALQHGEFVRAASRHKKELLARTLRTPLPGGSVATNRVMLELMFGNDKMLVRELAQTENFAKDDQPWHYRIPEDCVVLRALFDDISVASRINCFSPIGESMLEQLSTHTNDFDHDTDRRRFDGNRSDARWRSLWGAGLWLLRLASTTAMKQGHDWHMGLHYVPLLVERMAPVSKKNIDSQGEEFPTGYCYWIYDCINCLTENISLSTQLSKSNPNRASCKKNKALGRTHPLPQALHAYGQCVAKLLQAHDRLPYRFLCDRVHTFAADWSRSAQSWCGDQTFSDRMIGGLVGSAPSQAVHRIISRIETIGKDDDASDADYSMLIDAIRTQ